MKDLKEEIKIDETNLDKELSEQSARFVYYAEMAVKAEKEYQDFKSKAEEAEALLGKQLREELEAEGKKVTEKMLEQEIKTNDRYRQIRAKLLDLQTKRDFAKVYKEAWHMRKDMLVQIAINKRAEMESLMSGVASTDA